MDQKLMMRKKAMESLMEEPSLPAKKKPQPGDEGQEGWEQMFVSPEEKQMILDARAKEESAESPQEEQKEQSQGESPFEQG